MTFSLEDYVFSPIYRLIPSIGYPLGLFFLSRLFLKKKQWDLDTKNILSFYLIFLALHCSLIHISSLFFGVSLWGLKISGYAIIALGFLCLIKDFPKIKKIPFNFSSFPLILVVILYGFLSLSPASDADSLAYHLNLPVQFLNKGTLLISPIVNTHIFILSLGEMLNLIGLSIGTDCLGATTQWFSFLLFLNLFKENINKYWEKIIISQLILAPFLLLFLLGSQKNQLLGAITLCLSFILISKEKTWKQGLALIFIACSFKLSFSIIGSMIYLKSLIQHLPQKRVKYLFYSSICYLFFLFPFHLKNYQEFSTPIPPFLNFLAEPGEMKELMIFLQEILGSYKEGFGLPWGFLIPSSLGEITTTFGPIFLSFLFLITRTRKNQDFYFIMIMIGVCFILTQKTSRFFLTPYYLLIWYLVENLPHIKERQKKILFLTQQLQIIAVLFALGFSFQNLSLGAFSSSLRSMALKKNTQSYELSAWVNQKLPENVLFISPFRINIFLKRNYISQAPEILERSPQMFIQKLSLFKEKRWFCATRKSPSNQSPHLGCPYGKAVLIDQKDFEEVTRNPFRKRAKITWHLYEIPTVFKQQMR